MTNATAQTCDVVVFGAGFGGLATANLLAQMGRRVVLVEARRKIGGLLRSYKRDGLDCPVGVHYFGAAGRGELLGQVLDMLGVREALKLRRAGTGGVIDRYVFDDFTFDLPPTVDGFEASLRSRFPEHQEAVTFVIDGMRATVESMRIDAAGNVARGALGNTGFDESAEQTLRARGCPEGLLRILAVQNLWSGCDLSDCPLPYSLMFIGSLLRSAWELGCSGAEMADAIVHRCVEVGVQIVSADPVEHVLVTGGRACGVRLRSGLTIEARHVVSAVHPKLLVGMVPDGAWPESYANGIRGLTETPGAFCVIALVDAERHTAPDYNVVRIHERPEGGGEGVYVQMRPSIIEGHHRLVLMTQSDYDDWSRWHGTRVRHRGAEYEEKKRAMAEGLITLAQDVVGPLREPKIVDVWTPLTLRDYTGTIRGSIYGVRHSLLDGIERLVLTRTALPGLFVVGQNAIAPGLVGVALGALRVVGDIAGRAAFRQFLAERVGGDA